MIKKNILIIVACSFVVLAYQNCGGQFESISNSSIAESQYLAQLEVDAQFIDNQCQLSGPQSVWCECQDKKLSLGNCRSELSKEENTTVEPDEPMVVVEEPKPEEKPPVVVEQPKPEEKPPVVVEQPKPEEKPPVVVEQPKPEEKPPVVVEQPKPKLSIVSQNVQQIEDDSVKISWVTSDYSQGYIEFGESEMFGSHSVKETSFKHKSHTQYLESLKSGTKYFFRIHGTNKEGVSFVSVTKFFTTLKKEESQGPISIGNKKYLFFGGFEKNEGGYDSSQLKQYWGIRWDSFGSYGRFTSESDKAYRGNSLLVRYPGKILGSHLRINYASDFKKLNIPLKTSAYLRYYVKFHKGWEWKISGKIPGLAGYASKTGGDPVDGKNGWSMRWDWFYGTGSSATRKQGVPIMYAYVYARGKELKTYKYGLTLRLHDPDTKKEMQFPTDEWICLEQYVKLNDVGKANGVVTAWMNNKQGININDLVYRTVKNENTMIGQMLFSTFYGGNTLDYPPSKDTYASFDDFVISDQRIGCNAK